MVNQETIIAINKAINVIAEEYEQKTHYDEDGHPFEMSWISCVEHAIDDFMEDIVGYLECYDIKVNPEDEEEIRDYCFNNVNYQTVNQVR